MNESPYGPPDEGPYGRQPPPGPPSASAARSAVSVPAILMMIFGALGVLFSLYGLVSTPDLAQLEKVLDDPNLPPAVAQVLTTVMGTGGKLINLFLAAWSGAIVFGAVQMHSLKTYPAAVAAAVLSMFPCSSCCCVTLPIGIWALVVLLKPEVKAAFS